MTFTENQLEVSDAIYDLDIGEGIEFVNGVHVERVSPERFAIDGKEMCFLDAFNVAVQGIE